MEPKTCTIKSLHPIPHIANIVARVDGRNVMARILFDASGEAKNVPEHIAQILAAKKDSQGQPMYEVVGLKIKENKWAKHVPDEPEVNNA